MMNEMVTDGHHKPLLEGMILTLFQVDKNCMAKMTCPEDSLLVHLWVRLMTVHIMTLTHHCVSSHALVTQSVASHHTSAAFAASIPGF